MIDLFTSRTCAFSPCRTYRYELRIIWDVQRSPLMVIGLNPSKADENQDDPTLRRCQDFAHRWNHGGLVMTNLFAYRSTDPRAMLRFQGDAVGPDNDEALVRAVYECNFVLCAWGKHGAHQGRAATVYKRLHQFATLHCLRLNKDGSPEHPLYVPATTQPIPFPGAPA